MIVWQTVGYIYRKVEGHALFSLFSNLACSHFDSQHKLCTSLCSGRRIWQFQNCQCMYDMYN